MGQAKRRKLAEAQQPPAPVITDEQKQLIADAVQSVILPPNGQCWMRAVCGVFALGTLGLPARLVPGGMVYRAGPDADTDVVAFCGPNNQAYQRGYGPMTGALEASVYAGRAATEAGSFLGHMWVKSGDDLIDFSLGDWHWTSDWMAQQDGLGPVNWTAPPLPDFYWQPSISLTGPWRADGTPPIGTAWYSEGVTVKPGEQASLTRLFGELTTHLLNTCQESGALMVIRNNLRQHLKRHVDTSME